MAIDTTSLVGQYGYGNPDVAADGQNLYMQDPATISAYNTQYGPSASQQWVTQHNAELMQLGLALQTPDGIAMTGNVAQLLQQHGYTGPLDVNSLAQAYKMLRTPSPVSTTVSAPAAAGLNLGGIPQPLLIGGGALLVFFLLFRGGRG